MPKQESLKPVIFLGCSTEAAEIIAPAIQDGLSRQAVVQMWNQGFFRPGRYVLEELTDRARRFDFALLLFAADDLVVIRDQTLIAARDNTILEAGFFLSYLGRERTFIMVPDLPNLRIPSDLSGITLVKYPPNSSPDLIEAELGPACRAVSRAIERLGTKDLHDFGLTDGMVLLMGLMASKMMNSDSITVALAAFNRTDVVSSDLESSTAIVLADHGTSSIDEWKLMLRKLYNAWDKAGQFCVHHLMSIGLVEPFFGAASGYVLTEAGHELISQNYFKSKIQELSGRDLD